jgi:hypothetical protein
MATDRKRTGPPARAKVARRPTPPFSLRLPTPLRQRIRQYAKARQLEEATAARVLMAERLSEVEAAEELARAEAWQLAQAREAWRALLRGDLKLAPADGLSRIFREAEQRAASRTS